MLAGRFSVAAPLVVSLILVGCATTHPEKASGPDGSRVPADLGALAGGEWHVTSMWVDGKEFAVASDARPTFAVAEAGKVNGLATLNRYFGQLELLPGGEIHWAGPLGSTMMAGPENLMDQEVRFLQVLQRARKASFRDGALVLEDENGQNTLEFQR